jgi:hypothetical protein
MAAEVEVEASGVSGGGQQSFIEVFVVSQIVRVR